MCGGGVEKGRREGGTERVEWKERLEEIFLKR